MALYEITQDCRIANNEYQKGDVVSDTEVGGFYATVMKPTNQAPKKAEVKEEVKSELTDEEDIEVEVEKSVEKKSTKKGKRK